MTPIAGRAYNAGRGGTPDFARYVLREQRDPATYMASGRAVGPLTYVLDFGPVKTFLTPAQWAEQTSREGHSVVDEHWWQCDRCGVVMVAGDRHRCPDIVSYQQDGWT